jgi:ribosome-associated protein
LVLYLLAVDLSSAVRPTRWWKGCATGRILDRSGQPYEPATIRSSLIVPSMPATRELPIRGEMIRLGQLLKLAGMVDSGAEVKDLLERGAVRVNGEPEQRRGRQLVRGDEVSVEDVHLRVA